MSSDTKNRTDARTRPRKLWVKPVIVIAPVNECTEDGSDTNTDDGNGAADSSES